jgi:hypothetical protein
LADTEIQATWRQLASEQNDLENKDDMVLINNAGIVEFNVLIRLKQHHLTNSRSAKRHD